jgi:hypothetical protein
LNAVVNEFLREQLVGTRDDEAPVTKLEKYPAYLPRDRIKQMNLRVLNDFGVLDESGEPSSDTEITIAKLLSKGYSE